MNGKKLSAYMLGAFISVALFIVVVFTSFELVAFNEGIYARAQQQYGIDKITGISQSDLKDVTHKLLEYCKGNTKSLNMQTTVNGEMREVFGEREKAHMVDVQKLFMGGYDIRNGALIVFLLLTTALVSVARKDIYGVLARSWLATICVLGVLLAALGVYLIMNFSEAFYQFHLMFFDNDLWLLDPDTEVLIQMLPEQFFFTLVRWIVIVAASLLALFTGVALFVRHRCKKAAKRLPDPEHVES